MRKYESSKGAFPCRFCGILYPYSDLARMCEGVYPETKNKILDPLNAEVGEEILRTLYVGDDWAQPPYKGGIKLLYRWTYVREKRIIPANMALGISSDGWHKGERYCHIVQYRIGDAYAGDDELFTEIKNRWEDNITMNGMPLGPYHYWSYRMLEGKSPDEVIDEYCYGPDNNETRQKLIDEGYYVHLTED